MRQNILMNYFLRFENHVAVNYLLSPVLLFLPGFISFDWEHAERAKHLWGPWWHLQQHRALYQVSEGAGQSNIDLPAASKYTRSIIYPLPYHIKPTLQQLSGSSGYREPMHISVSKHEPTAWICAQWDSSSSDVLFPVADPTRGGESGRFGASGSHL